MVVATENSTNIIFIHQILIF